MSSSQTLADLHARLAGGVTEGKLTLAAGSTQVARIDAFVDSLPARQLVLNDPQFTLQEQSYPQTLTVAGVVSDSWQVRGLDGEGVALGSAALVFTRAQEGAEITGALAAEGSLMVGAETVAVGGALREGNALRFTHHSQTPLSMPLADVGNFISNSQMGEYLPADVPVFASVPVTALEVSFGYGGTTPSVLSFTSDVNLDWEFIKGFPPLKGVGVTLAAFYTQPAAGKFRGSFNVNFHATFNIVRDFQVVLAVQSKDFWEVRLLAAEGGVLPTLADVAYLAGGDSLRDSVQSGLDAIGLGGIALKSVMIGFDMSAGSLSYVRMDGEIGFAGKVVEISVQLPDFQFGGSLSRDTPLSLKGLVEFCFGSAENFPDAYVTEFDIGAHPSASHYSVRVMIEDDEFKVGPVSLRQVVADMEMTAGAFAGGIGAAVTLGGVDVFVSASTPGPGAGWDFEGNTGEGQQIPIGDLIQDLADLFGQVELPGPLAGLTVQDLKASFNTLTKDFTFSCEAKFPVDDQEVDITVKIEVKRNADGTYTKTFGGDILIGGYDFTLNFVQNAASDFFVAAYHPKTAGQALDVKRLVASVSSTVAGYVPDGLSIELKDVIFAYGKTAQVAAPTGTPTGTQAAASKFVFGLDIGAGINLSNLPLVGKEFPKDATVGVDDLQILFISQGLTADEVGKFNGLIPQGVTQFAVPPAQAGATQSGGGSSGSTTATTAVVLPQGFNVSAKMNFGGALQTLSLPGSGTTPTTPTTGAQTGTQAGATAAAQPPDGAKWFTLQKTFGPVYFEKVGAQYKDSVVWFLLNASLSFAGLTLSLDGLGVGSAIDKFDPKFKLQGLGVDYKGGGAVEIGGSFLRVEATAPDGTKYDEYDGAAVLKAEALTLSAIGSYAKLDGHPSLFIYAVLDYPLGGPSFFFVTGLAAGFGYNRALVIPPIDKVAQFPLVAEAVNSSGVRNSLTQELQSLRTYIPPTVGEMFLAVGVKFTSFKLIDSFVLLTVSFGTRFEVDVLGLSTLVVPPPEAGNVVTPLAEVQMAVRATFQPDNGFLGVQAQLTPASYILSRDCRLTGGFAFYSWFSGPHKGEFVQTLGGYHPSFRPPDYYPQVPRLGFNWRVDDSLTLKGEAYYALTASALMAGGMMQATWQSGNLKARFTAAADFIISWKPYHYDAQISIEASVSYTFNLFGQHTINVDVGARLHIWGPEFAGTASIDISVISFDVSFGSGKSKTPQPISWGNFKGSFLPAADSVCGISLQGGLVSAPQDGGVDWVVNPKEFRIVTDSVIPSMNAFVGTSATPFDAPHTKEFGIGPMAVTSKDLSTSHTVTIRSDSAGPSGEGFELKHFEFVPVLKRVPVGLWGQSLSPSIRGQAFVENALAGFEIRPKASTRPGVTADILTETLRYDPETVPGAYAWGAAAPFHATADDDAARREAIRKSITGEDVSKAREQLLSDLGVAATIVLSPSVADSFTMAPLVEAVPS